MADAGPIAHEPARSCKARAPVVVDLEAAASHGRLASSTRRTQDRPRVDRGVVEVDDFGPKRPRCRTAERHVAGVHRGPQRAVLPADEHQRVTARITAAVRRLSGPGTPRGGFTASSSASLSPVRTECAGVAVRGVGQPHHALVVVPTHVLAVQAAEPAARPVMAAAIRDAINADHNLKAHFRATALHTAIPEAEAQ